MPEIDEYVRETARVGVAKKHTLFLVTVVLLLLLLLQIKSPIVLMPSSHSYSM